MITFADHNALKQPVGGMKLEPQVPEDYVLGANDPKNLGQIVVEDGHWAPFAPVVEIQKTKDGADTYGCTGFSDNNCDEFIHKAKYGTEINISDKFVVVGSGTVRGIGNSMKGPAQFKHDKGFVMETDYPYAQDQTLDQFYATIQQAIYDKALENKKLYDSGYLFVNSAGQKALLDALKVSPIKIAVQGHYVADANGRIMNIDYDYNHAVALFDYVLDSNGNVEEWWIFCSETQQFLKFRGDYAFLSPMVKFLEKKIMFIKLVGSSAIFLPNPQSPKKLVPYGDGDVYKVTNQTTNYGGITTYATLEDLYAAGYSFDDWMMTKSPWDAQAFINSLAK